MKTNLYSFLSVCGLAMVGALLAGCVTAKTKPMAAKGGAQLWSENCARCHNSRSPSTYGNANWDVAMAHMRLRANLTAEESRKVLEFMKSAD